MQAIDFLRRVVPAAGVHVVAAIGEGQKFPRQEIADTLEDFAAEILRQDALATRAIYHACASFTDGKLDKGLRAKNNVAHIKSFWLDLDCGEGKDFADQGEACNRLVDFSQTVGLPDPLVVNSGNGIHAYWTFPVPVLPDRWRKSAEKLKQLCVSLNFPADSARTADSASVLRTPGTYNRKNGKEWKLVSVLSEGVEWHFGDIERTIDEACTLFGIKARTHHRADSPGINEGAGNIAAANTASADLIASKCQQMARCKETKGDVGERTWYASLQILKHCVNGDELIHPWSEGHPAYTHEATELKYEHAKQGASGPATCEQFRNADAQHCKGCVYLDKITSPIVLGTVIVEAPRVVVENDKGEEVLLPDPPFPFKRADDCKGIYMEMGEGKPPKKIYEYDFYPIEISFDPSTGTEHVKFKHYGNPQIPEDISVPSATLHEPQALWKALQNQHVQIQTIVKPEVLRYVESYIQRLRDTAIVRTLNDGAGWTEDGHFLYGSKLITPAGIHEGGMTAEVRDNMRHLRAKGDRQAWIDMTERLNRPELQQWTFFVMSAFGAALTTYTGSGGVCINGYSDASGIGKTIGLRWGASIFGAWDDGPFQGRVAVRSTANALVELLGVYRNLPMFIDEITDAKEDTLAEFVYTMSEGIGKRRLGRNSKLKAAAHWATYTMMSSNHSIRSKLEVVDKATEARAARLLEFEFRSMGNLEAEINEIHLFISDNYGLIGEEFIHALVKIGPVELKRRVNEMVTALKQLFGSGGAERFWINTLASNVVGTQVAYDAGLCKIDPMVNLDFMAALRDTMVGNMKDARRPVRDMISEYIDNHYNSQIIINKTNPNHGAQITVVGERPRSDKLLIRKDIDAGLLFLNRASFLAWMGKRGYSMEAIEKETTADGTFVQWWKQAMGAGADDSMVEKRNEKGGYLQTPVLILRLT